VDEIGFSIFQYSFPDLSLKPPVQLKGQIMKTKTILLALVWILSLPYIFGADFWDKKPYTKWKQKECGKLLKKSPWSHPYAITGVNIPGMMRPGGGEIAGRSFGDNSLTTDRGDREVHIFLQIRLVTAKPVKAAIGQSRLLADPKNKDLQNQVEQYVNQDDGPEMVVEVTYYSEPSGHSSLRQVEGFLRTTTLPAIQNKIWLSSSSKDIHIPILRYQGPYEGYNGALLFFPRNDESGNPNFDGSEKNILFHMETNFGTVDLLLKPKDMTFEDEFTM
jgi:hypothetical protein